MKLQQNHYSFFLKTQNKEMIKERSIIRLNLIYKYIYMLCHHPGMEGIRWHLGKG